MYVAARNLGVMMRALFNMGTPKGLQRGLRACARALSRWFMRLGNGVRRFLETRVTCFGTEPIPDLRDRALCAA